MRTKTSKQIYKRKPDYIEAIQYFDTVEILTDLSALTNLTMGVDYGNNKVLKIYQDKYISHVYEGDFVCRDTAGEVFGMSREKFLETYEKATP